MIEESNIKSKGILIILDGWGVAPPSRGNAITLAKTPFFSHAVKKYPYTEICAHGFCAGLPKNQPGNSEAGHLNLGAGRVVKDDAVYISESIQDGTFFKNPAFLEGINYFKDKFASSTTRQKTQKVHLMGLVTEESSAHSSPEHWLAMIRFLNQENIKEVFLHLFTDGRDSGQHAAIKILERFNQEIKNNNHHSADETKVVIASVVGRFYAMDRTKRWQNVEQAYNLLTSGKGLKVKNAQEAIIQAYNRGETDEFISPTVIVDEKENPLATINDNDVVIFMNLRSDRARQLTKSFVQKDFNKKNPGSFKRKKYFKDLFFIALTDFGPDLDEIRTAYPSREMKNSLPSALDGLQQFYITETEKYAHLTYFFNGGYDHPVAGEERVVIPSPQEQNYDQVPKMSADKVCQRVIKEINTERPDFIAVNFCNPDMLGHTGNLEATIKGVEHVDRQVAKIVGVAKKKKYWIIITADHGNAEQMINLKTGEIETNHTVNRVPFIIINALKENIKLKKGGKLADVAPTILDLMSLKKPREMTGNTLIRTLA